MRKLGYFLGVIAMAMALVVILLTAVDYACFDRSFYDAEYQKLDTARTIGMKHSDLLEVTDHLLRYVRGEEESLRIKARIDGKSQYVFNERERSHMMDVQALYRMAMKVRNILALAALALLLLTIPLVRRDRLQFYSKCCLWGFALAGVCVAAVGIWAAADFSGFWTAFHHIVFDNDLWLLDPSTDILILMVPGQFFFDLVMRIVHIVAVAAGIPLLLAAGYMIYRTWQRRALLTIRGPEGSALSGGEQDARELSEEETWQKNSRK